MGEFGEKSNHGLYLPMSEDESDTLNLLWENKEYRLYDKNLGQLEICNVIVGDKRIGIHFKVGPKCFETYEIARPFPIFKLELWARGRLLFQKEMTTMYNGQYLMVQKGFSCILALDIALDKINPELVKEVAKTKGLTSRRGNEKFTSKQRFLIKSIEEGNRKIKSLQGENLRKAKRVK